MIQVCMFPYTKVLCLLLACISLFDVVHEKGRRLSRKQIDQVSSIQITL